MSSQPNYKIKCAELDNALFSLHEYGINPRSREIYLTGWEGPVDEEPGVDYRMAMKFIRNLSFLNEQGEGNILVRQCSVGGEWEYGMAIHNAIAASPNHITMLCYGHSRSMSSITLQAADLRILMPDCTFMVHHGSIYMEDTHRGAVSYMEHANRDADRMVEIYAERCNLTERQLKNRMDKRQEWYMTAEEAVEHGFADGILGTEKYPDIASIRR